MLDDNVTRQIMMYGNVVPNEDLDVWQLTRTCLYGWILLLHLTLLPSFLPFHWWLLEKGWHRFNINLKLVTHRKHVILLNSDFLSFLRSFIRTISTFSFCFIPIKDFPLHLFDITNIIIYYIIWYHQIIQKSKPKRQKNQILFFC